MTRLSCMHDRRSGERTHDHGSSVLMDMPSPRRWPFTNALSPLPNKEIPLGVPEDRAARPLGVRRAYIAKQFDVPWEHGNGGLLAEICGNPAQRAVRGRLISGGLCIDKICFAQNKFYYCKVLRGPFRVRVSTRTGGRIPAVTRAIVLKNWRRLQYGTGTLAKSSTFLQITQAPPRLNAERIRTRAC